ncbi:MAG: FAD-binding oxidoreductase [Lysobacterales bacterium]
MAQARSNDTLIEQLQNLLGPSQVAMDGATISLMSQDVYSRGESVSVVVSPSSTQQLSQLVAMCAAAGQAVVARGGGMSYTAGYLATQPGTVLVDMSAMNQIVEINAEDMYVTVQSGCTWQDLHEALKDTGLRTPFWGTLSGITATVGGGMSQNSMFWGSARYGISADSVIGMEVVLADGEVMVTGSGAQPNGSPFFRHFGPDLTGLFTGDNGALGLKATVTLRLIQQMDARRYLSFDFDDHKDMISAMSEVSRQGLATESFGFDPCLTGMRMKRESLAKDVKSLAGVMKASGSVGSALKSGLKVAMAGRKFMEGAKFSLHLMVEERVDAAADACAQSISDICKQHRGTALDDSIPRILRANPFTPLNNVIGPNGERWAPIHGLLPHSKAAMVTGQVHDLEQREAATIEKHNIEIGYLFATVSTSCFVLEPVFYWPDAMQELHDLTVEPSVRKRLKGFDENLEARAEVHRLRKAMVDIFAAAGAVHFQVGKTYPLSDVNPRSWKALSDIKGALDPAQRINPGSLGLGGETSGS